MENTKISQLLKNKSSALSGLLVFFIFCIPLALNQSLETTLAQPQVLGDTTNFLIRGYPNELEPPQTPVKKGELNLTQISAQSLLAYDEVSGEILAQKNSVGSLGIASLTKLLTAVIIYQNLNMEEFITVQQRDILNVSPSLNLKLGDKLKVFDLFNAMLIGSCNDAALMLANHTAEKTGVSFENLMNLKAAELGMTNSHFSNPMGFDNVGNFSTAEDLKLLVNETLKLQVFAMEGRRQDYSFKSSTGQAYKTAATNKLIGQDAEISNIKTGYTNQSLGSMITKATRNGHSIIIIILGSKNREQDTINLKEQAFDNFTWANNKH